MRFIFIVIICGFLFTNCKKDQFDAPSCIQEKIQGIMSKSVRNPPGAVYEYEYNGRNVYLIPGECCDQYDLLFDSDCNLICVFGGIAGGGNGTCPDFYSQAKLLREVWKDPR